jgi:hypothetical protein
VLLRRGARAKRQQKGGEAVAEQRVTRGWGRAGEMAGGEPVRPLTPATEEQRKQSRGGGQNARRKKR